MAEQSAAEDLREAEHRLQAAQLAGDVPALDRLLDDRLIFTGPDGKLYSKFDDLENHRTGRQTVSKLVEEDLTTIVVGDTGVTWFLGTLEGEIAGTPFAAQMRYTRTWFRDDAYGWRIIAAHASPV